LKKQLTMMIKTVAAIAALATAVHGFSAPSVPRPDSSGAVKLAMEITAAKGINSPEAKVAWDIVEELDASDNRCVGCFAC
jgi:CP12 domain